MAAELDRRVEADQDARGFALRGERPTDAELQRMREVDEDNTAWLEQIVAEAGWPGFRLVGQGAAQNAWLLAQHADRRPWLQERWLELLRAAVDAGDAAQSCLAYLDDRVAVHQGRPQRHGTQWTVIGGESRLAMLEDPLRVNEFRAACDLDPLSPQEIAAARSSTR